MSTNKFVLVEVIVPANTTQQVGFTDQATLNGKKIAAIETFSIQAVSVAPSGTVLISIADFKKAFLVLLQKSTNKIFQIPLVALNRVRPDQTTAANFVPAVDQLAEFENMQDIDWTSSYVKFGAAPAATAFSILFGVHYKD